MRPVRTTVIGLLAALAASASPLVAQAAPGDDRLPASRLSTGTTDASQQASAALAAVTAAFDGTAKPARRAGGDAHPGRQLTMLLRDLRLGLDELDGTDRDRAEDFLARPTGTTEEADGPLYGPGAAPLDDCTVAPTLGSNVCVHWATATVDAPDLADGDADGVPDQVESTRDVLDDVWRSVVTQGGYRAPRSDLASADHGPDGRLDVYLADLGASRLYGYCTTDDPAWETAAAVSSYCVVDDDFATTQFRGDPLENLQVTAAHEFFHAVQYAYDWTEDHWLLEGTAAWVEDELYDAVDDNRQYLDPGPMTNPEMPLDYAGSDYNPYASWIFWRYLGERFPAERGTGMPVLIRDVIGRTGGSSRTDHGVYSTQALTRSLDVPLPKVLTQFVVANRRPATAYEEGRAYPATPLALSLGIRNGKAQRVDGGLLDLSSATVRLVPGRQLTGKRWKVRVSVDLPRRSYGYAAAVTTVSRSGKVTTEHVKLSSKGDGSASTVFGRRKVKSVEVALVNASVRTDCWQGTALACQGVPKDFGRPVTATVKAFR